MGEAHMSWNELNADSPELDEWLTVKNEYCCPDNRTEFFMKEQLKHGGRALLYKDNIRTLILAVKYIRKVNRIKIIFGGGYGSTTLAEKREAFGIMCDKIKEILREYNCKAFSRIWENKLAIKAQNWLTLMSSLFLENGIKLTIYKHIWNYELV